MGRRVACQRLELPALGNGLTGTHRWRANSCPSPAQSPATKPKPRPCKKSLPQRLHLVRCTLVRSLQACPWRSVHQFLYYIQLSDSTSALNFALEFQEALETVRGPHRFWQHPGSRPGSVLRLDVFSITRMVHTGVDGDLLILVCALPFRYLTPRWHHPTSVSRVCLTPDHSFHGALLHQRLEQRLHHRRSRPRHPTSAGSASCRP